MNPFEMVIGIVLIVMIGNVLKARYKAKHGILEDEDGNERLAQRADTGEAVRLREDVRALKERVQVLERVITDQRQTSDLSLEIEKLRDR
ncbi:hypothetical protein [Blastomonas sp.]|uniref:hypothetical protein n=1 Tax=Blastomonas sp. TaxID=1909299 RepID=UPI0026373DDA|nr:hypothetical protein [Blastomonas sp.]MDM7955454.1 hypothetical protein [Blastomonas sp.]